MDLAIRFLIAFPPGELKQSLFIVEVINLARSPLTTPNIKNNNGALP